MSEFSFTKVGDTLLVEFGGREILDMSIAEQIHSELSTMISEGDMKGLILDFTSVRLMTSTMIGKLTMLRNQCEEEEKLFCVCCVMPEMMELIKMMKLTDRLKICDTRQQALHYCGELGSKE